MLLMYDAADDAVVLNQVPADAYAVAGYVGPVASDNHYVTYPAVLQRFHGKAHTLGIAVQAHYDAECLDIETSDATPDQAPEWLHRQLARGVWRPVLYCQGSTMPTLQGILNRAGFKRDEYRLWIAAYPGTGENVPEGMDAHQFRDTGFDGSNMDVSVVNPDFFAPAVKPQDPDSRYEWFDTGPFKMGKLPLNERAVVQAYDKYRATQTLTKHPNRAKLAVLRAQLKFLKSRLYTVAHRDKNKNGSPSWERFHRGWRYQELAKRAAGQRLV